MIRSKPLMGAAPPVLCKAHRREDCSQCLVLAGAPRDPATIITKENPLTIVLWLWRSEAAAQYKPYHVNVAARMIDRYLTLPHRIIALTDQPEASYDPIVTPVPLWDDWRALRNGKWGRHKPHCYVRLKAFSREARAILGRRFVSIDLDCLVVGNLDPLFDRPETFLIFRRKTSPGAIEKNCYQGSMWMMIAGCRAQVWEDFKGAESVLSAAHFMGTDQAWIRHRLGPDEPGWGEKDGVLGWPDVETNPAFAQSPPPGARIIFFYGVKKPEHYLSNAGLLCKDCGGHNVVAYPPWSIQRNARALQDYKWIGQYYR